MYSRTHAHSWTLATSFLLSVLLSISSANTYIYSVSLTLAIALFLLLYFSTHIWTLPLFPFLSHSPILAVFIRPLFSPLFTHPFPFLLAFFPSLYIHSFLLYSLTLSLFTHSSPLYSLSLFTHSFPLYTLFPSLLTHSFLLYSLFPSLLTHSFLLYSYPLYSLFPSLLAHSFPSPLTQSSFQQQPSEVHVKHF